MKTVNSKVNPPVEYEVDGIPLNLGLDLTTNTLQIDKGSLRDCLNFEVVDRLGYQTISGFDRYNGALSPDKTEFFVLRYTPATDAITIQSALFGPDGGFFGVAVATGSDDTGEYVVYARASTEDNPADTDSFSSREFGVSTVYSHTCDSDPVLYQSSFLRPVSDKADDILEDFEVWNDRLRGRVTSLPEQPIGLHWFRDRLYVVCNQQQVQFTSGNTEILPNMYIRPTATADYCAKVLDVTVVSGTYGGGDAAGYMTVEPVPFFEVAETIFGVSPPRSNDVDLLENVPDVSNWNDPANTIATSAFIAAPIAANTPEVEYAGLWRDGVESNPQWSNVETGWVVDFENGFSFSGGLRKVERALDNSFVFDTVDESGLPALFFNGTRVSPENPDITSDTPGWKISQTPDDDATSIDNLVSDDGDYLIGDIDFGFRKNDGLPVRLDGERTRLADTVTVPTLALPTSGNRQPGYSDGRCPLLMLSLGPILDLIPADAQLSGIEFEIKAKGAVGAGGLGRFDTALYATFNDLQDALVQHFSTMFKISAQFGNFSGENNQFETVGQKRTTTVALPATRASYTFVDTSASPAFYQPTVTYADAADQTLTIGSSSDLFNIPELTRDKAIAQNFGLILWGETIPTAGAGVFGTTPFGSQLFSMVGAGRISLDQVVLKIYYDQPSARYYAADSGDPSKVLTFDLVAYNTFEGRFVDSNASGKLQIVNVKSVNSGADYKSCLVAGDEIFLDSTLTRKVADVAGTTPGDIAMFPNGLPSLKNIVEAGSRYQFITANFFAREDWDGFYGVSGAGQAFSFASFDADDDGDNEDYLQKIYTNTAVVDEDKPRHVAFHQYHLALGFRDGTVRFSVVGEPENFSGELGAAEIGVGDRVTGLLAMRGKALGVFCEGSIYTVLGSNVDEFTVETLAPSTGAIEYTVVDMGIPLYCDNRGISTLEQSQKYGNFVGIRLSQRVSPWIRPRLTRSDDLFSLEQGAGVVCAIPVRAKNQYRVFFRDGAVLVLTINGDTGTAFTFSKYYLNEDEDEFFVPIGHSSEVDGNGAERIHMAHYSPRSAISDSDALYVHEFEKGLGFDGSWFDAWFETSFYHRDPFRDSTIRLARAEGLTKGYGPYTITVAKEYDEDSYSSTLVPINLPRNPADTVSIDYKPTATMANIAKEGRCLSYRIEKSEATGDKIQSPPVVFQTLLLQYQPGGKRDA